MSSTARRAAAALLCAVVVGALGLAVVSIPADDEAPEPLDVALDFDTFVPGHTQIRSSTVDVPVTSTVAKAGILSASGRSSEIVLELTLCDRSSCSPFREGARVEPGIYTLNVAATLAADAEPGRAGTLAGEILLVEDSASTMAEPRVLVGIAAIGIAVLALAAAALQRREVFA